MKKNELRNIIREEIKKLAERRDIEPERNAEIPGVKCYTCNKTDVRGFGYCTWTSSGPHRSTNCMSRRACERSCNSGGGGFGIAEPNDISIEG